LKREPSLAYWELHGEKVCGLAAWQLGSVDRLRSERLTRLLDEPRALIDAASLDCDPATLSVSDLLALVFDWVAHPVIFTELTTVVCGLKQIDEQRPLVTGELGGRAMSEWVPDNQRWPDEKAEWTEFLGRLWMQIEGLPHLQRLAYLLNFTAADGQLDLFWIYGVVGIRSIGTVLQISEKQFERIWSALDNEHELGWRAQACETYDEKFALLWQYLPLADMVIADALGTERQRIINLRKSAADRLSRLMTQSAPPWKTAVCSRV
jgi:hypothetical protein